MAGQIAKWWMPDDVVFIDEIPHTATGKIQKLALREQFKDYRPADSRRCGIEKPSLSGWQFRHGIHLAEQGLGGPMPLLRVSACFSGCQSGS